MIRRAHFKLFDSPLFCAGVGFGCDDVGGVDVDRTYIQAID